MYVNINSYLINKVIYLETYKKIRVYTNKLKERKKDEKEKHRARAHSQYIHFTKTGARVRKTKNDLVLLKHAHSYILLTRRGREERRKKPLDKKGASKIYKKRQEQNKANTRDVKKAARSGPQKTRKNKNKRANEKREISPYDLITQRKDLSSRLSALARAPTLSPNERMNEINLSFFLSKVHVGSFHVHEPPRAFKHAVRAHIHTHM